MVLATLKEKLAQRVFPSAERYKPSPHLFGKYKPTKFQEFYADDPGRFNDWYDLPFAQVRIESCNVHYPTHTITAEAMPRQRAVDLDFMFDPRFEELYSDAKTWVANRLQKASRWHPTLGDVDIEKHSKFSRHNRLDIQLDIPRAGIDFEDIQAQNNLLQEIYQGLEDHLADLYGVERELLGRKKLEIILIRGNVKETQLPNELGIFAESPSEEYGIGNIYVTLFGAYGSKKKEYAQLVQEALSSLKQFQDVLKERDGNFAKIEPSQADFRIDLSSLSLPPQLAGEVLSSRALCENKTLLNK